jgi:hypothetical protein
VGTVKRKGHAKLFKHVFSPSSSGVFLEETSGRERKEHPDQFNLQLEQQKVTG